MTMGTDEKIKKEPSQGWYIDTLTPEEKAIIDAQTQQGWTQPNPDLWNQSGTQPTTAEERDWIANFILENGRLPASQEMAGWNEGLGNETYLPGSTMYELGWRQEALPGSPEWMAYQTGGYGPNTGNLIPDFGTTVLTDKSGKPFSRIVGRHGFGAGSGLSDVTQGYIQRGQYIKNPNDPTVDYRGYPEGFSQNVPMGEDYVSRYNQYKPPETQQDFKAMSEAEYLEMLKQQNPNTYFQDQVSEFLNEKGKSEYISNQDLQGELTGIQEQLTKEDKAMQDALAKQDTVVKGLQAARKNTENIKEQKALDEKINLATALYNSMQYTPETDITQEKAQEILANSIKAGVPSTQAMATYNRMLMEIRAREIGDSLNNTWTYPSIGDKDKVSYAQAIYNEVQNMLEAGFGVDEIKDRLQQAYGFDSKELKELGLTEKRLEAMNKVNEQRQSQWMQQRDFNTQQGRVTDMAKAGFAGAAAPQDVYTPPQPIVTGTEKVDFQEYAESLKVSPNSKAWLYDNFGYISDLWQRKGQGKTLMQFVQEYLANGGWSEYANLPANQRGVNTKRFAPTVRR